MSFESRPNMVIRTETTYDHHRCQVCGDPCGSDPNLCERHRDPRQYSSTFKFQTAVVCLGRNEPCLGRDIVLKKIQVEGYKDEVHVSMDLYPARKITKKKNQMHRKYPKMVLRLMDGSVFTVKKVIMFIDEERVDMDAYSFQRRYTVRMEGETVEMRKP